MNVEDAIDALQDAVSQYQTANGMRIGAAINGGHALIAIRQTVKHGGFLPYLEQAGISDSTAERWMKLARTGQTPQQVADQGGIVATLEAVRNYQPTTDQDVKIPTVENFDSGIDTIEDVGVADDSVAETPPNDTAMQASEPPPAAQEPPEVANVETPKPPTKLEQAEGKIALLEMELHQTIIDRDQLSEQLQHVQAQTGESDWEKVRVLQSVQAQLSAANASVGEWMTRAEEWKREAMGLRKALKRTEAS